jgi:hypothetical protein
MQNDKAKFKNEFKGRVYKFALDVIRFVGQLSPERTSRIVSERKKMKFFCILGCNFDFSLLIFAVC